ncbi:MAG: hypothetical protein PUE74_06920 [Faecalibacterium sp.]|nr:hypothetical protein [Faecalibacterium sp.]
MTTYICKCGQRVQKSSSADNTGNRLKGYGPGHECYGCPYAMPWGGNEWNETAKRFVQDIKGYECRMSRTLSYGSLFIGSTKDTCICSVFSLDFDFMEQISAWVKDTFSQGELTGGFSRDKIRPTDYSHNGRYCCTFVCAANKKGISAKAALLARFFNPDGSRKDMTPQQEMEKILADIKKAKEGFACAPAQNADAAVTTAENAVPTATAATPTISESGADASASTPATSLQNCESAPAASAGGSSVPMPSAPSFDFSALGDLAEQAVETDQQFDLHYGTAQDEYLISCIYVAKMHALTAKAGRYGGGTWTKWYESKGMSEGSARTMTQNGDAFKSATVADLKLLPSISRKDLNLIARSGYAEQLTAAAGDSQRVQELLAQLKAEKERADSAEAREEEAWKMQSRAEARAKNAEGQLSGSRQVAEAAKLRADKLQEENAALKKQPIAAVVDEEEVERRANQRAHDIAEDLAAEMTADLQARLEQASSGSEQDARDAYDGILLAGRNISNAWQAAKLLFPKMPPEQRETAADQLIHTLGQIQGEVSRCL